MSAVLKRLSDIRKKENTGYWSERIIYEMEYGYRVSKMKSNQYHDLIDEVGNFILERYRLEGTITKELVIKAEEMLSGMGEDAKSLKMICTAHAHIDMNWMWGWDETTSITLDTFTTMLKLLREYPDFTFSQSQASVYRIVEKYAPEMLDEIKERIKEGRWEVTASTWVEGDKNLPNGESLARHILYTKRYLASLLDIDPESLNLNFEPDTFGHALSLPEILSKGGVKYFYHCRGDLEHFLFKWVSPSGNSVIAYREPIWYNGKIEPEMALYVPEFSMKYGMDTMLKVYGVGDHGGGPTRRDLETLMDMKNWPVFPQIRFGTYEEFFKLTEKVADQLPVVTDELNFIQTGCYTSQSRIKLANRIAEAALHEAESFNSYAALSVNTKYPKEIFEEAWRNVLFNQFHDIIPGSCTLEPKEHAMGLFQETMAIAGTRRKISLQSIASEIDTSNLIVEEQDLSHTRSEGAGAGFGTGNFRISQNEQGAGTSRIFHVFNPSARDRDEAVEIIVWDWQGDTGKILVKDGEDHIVQHQILDNGFNNYWGHHYLRLLIQAKVPSCGYNTYIITEEEEYNESLPYFTMPRVEKPDRFVLENQWIRVVFDDKNASIVSVIDKSTGQECIDTERVSGVFRYIEEDSSKGRTSWLVGRHMNVKNLTENVRIKNMNFASNKLRQSISYEIEFGSSWLKALVSLDYDSPRLKYQVECDWHEMGIETHGIPEAGFGIRGKYVPQLSFYMPLNYKCHTYKYDIPFGIIERNGMDLDVPANSWTIGVRKDEGKKATMMVTDTKYGFRCVDDAISLTLIRSSYNPDPYPEQGIHRFGFAICFVENRKNKSFIDLAFDYNHPMSTVSNTVHKGSMPSSMSFFTVEEGQIAVSAVKMPEEGSDSNKWILRVYETEGQEAVVSLLFFKQPSLAYFVDINERKVESDDVVTVEGNRLRFHVLPNQVASLYVAF